MVLFPLRKGQSSGYRLQSNQLMMLYQVVASPLPECMHGNVHLEPEATKEILKSNALKYYVEI